jgi:hypothetical protein
VTFADVKRLARALPEAVEDLMLTAEPKLFFITDHYKGYPAILVRLGIVRERRMRELLEDAYRFVAPQALVAQLDATH